MEKSMQKLFSFIAAAWLALGLTGCASIYVDTATKEVPVASFKKPATPKPVQFVFDFQTKGVANATATKYLSEQVTMQIKDSGLFSTVQTEPVADGALLSLVINNVPLTEDAASKGFVTGLTFGLAGSQVTDGYICTVKYLPGTQGATISKTARHAIHTVLGAKEDPPNATKAEGIEAAVRTMTREIVSNVLNELSQDPGFQ